jgi:hypothetical protein
MGVAVRPVRRGRVCFVCILITTATNRQQHRSREVRAAASGMSHSDMVTRNMSATGKRGLASFVIVSLLF